MLAFLNQRRDILPSFAIFAAACGWGLFWIPMRALDEAGIHGAWAPVAIYAAGALLLLPLACARWRPLLAGGLPLFLTGLAFGGTFAFYLNSLLFTDIVRALLLFYLAPVWSTLLQSLFLKERITLRHLLVIVLGLGGLVTILGVESGFPLPRNLGDWLAIAGGLSLAISTTRIRAQTHIHMHESNYAFYFAGGLFAFGLAFLLIEPSDTLPSAHAMLDTLIWFIPLIVIFVIPANYLIIYGAQRISPSRAAIMMMMEVVTGVVSASILTEEPFGLREALGSALILSAGVAEVVRWPIGRAAR